MFPLRKDGSGLFDNDAPVIEIDKPKNVMLIHVLSYKIDDNYEFIKEMAKQSKRGIAIYISEHQDAVDLQGNLFGYEFGVDTEKLRLRDLDEIVMPEDLNEESQEI